LFNLDYHKLDFVSVVMSSFLLHDIIPAFGHPNPDLAYPNVPIRLCHCGLSHPNHVWSIPIFQCLCCYTPLQCVVQLKSYDYRLTLEHLNLD